MKILKPHQIQALEYLKSRFQGALLMEMRLGKNLTLINHLDSIIKAGHNILFVTQYGAMNSFADEATEFGHPAYVLSGIRKKRMITLRKVFGQPTPQAGWVICNYESVKLLELHNYNWKAVALDETIKIANPKSAQTKYFLSHWWRKINLRFILNGKVNPESLFQICTQFLFLHGQYMGCKTFWEYRAKYYMQTSAWEWLPKLGHKKAVHDYVHKHAFVLLRKDANIGPDKLYKKRYVRMNSFQIESNKALIQDFEIAGVLYKNELGINIGLAYLASGMLPSEDKTIISNNKFDELIAIIEEIEGKILVWCRFRAEQKHIIGILKANNIKCIGINGDMNINDRNSEKLIFETEAQIKCAVLTIASCAKGQDWSVADTSIYFSNAWSNDLRGQSEDRLVHLSKKQPVLIIDLISEDSIEEEVVTALRNKEFDSKMVMGNFLSRCKRA